MLVVKSRARGKPYRRCCGSGRCARRCQSPCRSACRFPPRPASPVRTRPAAVAINKHNRRDAGTGQLTEASVVACHLALPAEPRSGPATSQARITAQSRFQSAPDLLVERTHLGGPGVGLLEAAALHCGVQLLALRVDAGAARIEEPALVSDACGLGKRLLTP